MQRQVGDFGRRVPYRHINGANCNRALAVTSGLFVGHHAGPDFVRIEVVAFIVNERVRRRFVNARNEALAHQIALTVAAVGIEAVTNDGLAIAHHIGDDRDQAQRHLTEVDVGVADRRFNRAGRFEYVDDFHGRYEQEQPRWRRDPIFVACALFTPPDAARNARFRARLFGVDGGQFERGAAPLRIHHLQFERHVMP